MQKIQWDTISEDQFQELCIKLLYREGYRNIMPLGSRGIKEDGRDAFEELVIGESENKKIIAFQFKRWTSEYSPADIKRLVKKELDEKIIPSGQKIDEYKFITCHPLTKVKKWFSEELPLQYSFPIQCFEKTWLENRLESENQDLRRHYFGIEIERHSPESLMASCLAQTEKAIRSVGVKYIAELYIERPIEDEFRRFLSSDKSCFLIVDRSGQGKTNLLCHLAEVLRIDMPVMLIFGAKTITDEHGLAMHIVEELGYSGSLGTRWQSGLEDVIRICRQANFAILILIDGVSENDDLVKMKRALRELLDKYGTENSIKFVFTCRDSLWTRFRTDFPQEYIYTTESQKNLSSDAPKEFAQFLGDWSTVEFEAASLSYAKYFNIQFELSENAKQHCKYPLLFRLFCETYSSKNIGFIPALPFRKVVSEYFEIKTQRIADYFGLGISPDRIRVGVLKIREEMWLKHDKNSLSRNETDKLFGDLNLLPIDEVLARMCDEGVLIKTSVKNEEYIRFAFDELSDYFLFTIFSEQSLKDCNSDIERIDSMCQLVNSDVSLEAFMAEKYLVLLSRNTEDSVVLAHLLDSILMLDLNIFSQCVWQRLAVNDFLEKSDIEKTQIFGQRLIYFYNSIIEKYFSAIKLSLDPFVDASSVLGLIATASPNIRELSYSYKTVKDGKDILEVKSVNRFPTWTMSFNDHKIHDPENGIFISSFRDFPGERGVLRSLDFEWNLPFKGVSLAVPDRVALYDIWNELAHILDKHQIREPKDLLIERANSLSQDLPKDLLNIKDPDAFVKKSNDIEKTFPKNTWEIIEFQRKVDEYLYYLTVLKTNAFEKFVPLPDLLVISPEQHLQNFYSKKRLAEYLQAVFSKFLNMYYLLIEENFKDISRYLNLYQQIPVSFFILVNSSRTYVRVFVFPEEKGSEASIRINFLESNQGESISDGILRVNDNKPSDEAVKEALLELGRNSGMTAPIDVLIPMDELFKMNPINNLTVNWVKSELSQILRVSFIWPNG